LLRRLEQLTIKARKTASERAREFQLPIVFAFSVGAFHVSIVLLPLIMEARPMARFGFD
jgi:3'-phosphoadenosine 5'-phosphosulfate sulfotransferase (PAPS reductase)/FAD synthetase